MGASPMRRPGRDFLPRPGATLWRRWRPAKSGGGHRPCGSSPLARGWARSGKRVSGPSGSRQRGCEPTTKRNPANELAGCHCPVRLRGRESPPCGDGARSGRAGDGPWRPAWLGTPWVSPGTSRPLACDLRDFCQPKQADWPPGLDRLACTYSRNTVTIRPLGVGASVNSPRVSQSSPAGAAERASNSNSVPVARPRRCK